MPSQIHCIGGIRTGNIPSYVLCFLGKGEKRVPDASMIDFKGAYMALENFKIALFRKAVLRGDSLQNDPFARIRLKQGQHTPSSWMPKDTEVPIRVKEFF